MNKLGLVITDGVGFRNYILSNFLKEAQNQFEEIIIFSGLPKSCFNDINTDKCVIENLENYRESSRTWMFRKLKEVAHLQNHKKGNFGIRTNLKKNYPTSKSKRALLVKLIFAWTNFFNSEKWINRYYKSQQKSFKNNQTTKRYISLLKKYKPGLLYFTHQRPPYIAPLIYASNKVKIKTATFIFSWDNIPSKGRMSGDFNYYFVWSHLMKEELLSFYVNIKPEQIIVVGTPQFEPYVLEKYKIELNVFTNKFDLDVTKKTICYSCGDVSTSKNDPFYIKTIAEAISRNKIKQPVNLLVRTSPVEDATRFASLKDEYPFIKWNYPKWILSRKNHQETWSQRIPTTEDIIDLKGLLAFSDIAINMCSTMSLDAMFFDKPVINPVFGNKENGLYNDQKYLKYQHYERVVENNAVAVVKTAEELIDEINTLLENPQARLEAQKELLKLQISYPLKGTGERIATKINQCIKETI
ncbi:glycosyltransferase family protein [Pontimicrobium aquaticum]|uniref:CDP-Glycerol:Poly(Glycerophosphate) glycerophosphotransferase n=1 Tax=Pontimicrobium aquaticum TaxID=2565367 RepID=A0A4U0EP92_9FLAO|nr:hypothetical protein [Pontimicrobium aquaticum]TJY32904.1 hypothetical protein E5167_13795 [Pontimicrobium aquaticum]